MSNWLEFLTRPLLRQFSGRLERELGRAKRTAKRIGIGLLCFRLSESLFLIGVLFLLAALFLQLSHFQAFVTPSVWTGLASVGGAAVWLIIGLLALV